MNQFSSNHSQVSIPQESPRQGTQQKPYRVLVISDDAVNGRQGVAYLVKAGLECRLACGAAAGIAAFRENNIPLVLLDLNAQAQAETFCAKIRESSIKPVVMLGDEVDKEAQLRGLKVGADDYMARSADMQLVAARIIALLRRVYIYGSAEDHTQPLSSTHTPHQHATTAAQHHSAPAPQLPAGWATCEGCNYMGPVHKFESKNSLGQVAMKCPHCRLAATVTYAVS